MSLLIYTSRRDLQYCIVRLSVLTNDINTVEQNPVAPGRFRGLGNMTKDRGSLLLVGNCPACGMQHSARLFQCQIGRQPSRWETRLVGLLGLLSSPLCVGSNHNNDFLTVVNILATLQQLQIRLTNSLAHKLY